MDGLDNFISTMDYVLNSKRKRHIMGGHSSECLFIIWWVGINGNDD